MVQRDEIDLVISDLSFSVQRRKVVDHLYPIYDYHHSLVYWRPGKDKRPAVPNVSMLL